jgi:hypothetical protein
MNERNLTPPFKKGHSGNPGGRPKEFAAVKALARKHAEEAIQVLVQQLSSEDAKLRIAAANALLDRAIGKPVQPQAGADGDEPLEVTFRWASSFRVETMP